MKRYAKVGSQWLARVDKNSILMETDWIKHVEAEYGVTGVELMETDNDTDPRIGELLMPPVKPQPPREPTLEERLATVEAKLKALEKV